MKLTISKSKNSASFYVQKTIRKPNGSVTTITIEKLGNLTEVTSKAGGKDPYVWAQDYVNELNRKEYEENKEIIVSYSPSKLLKKNEQPTLKPWEKKVIRDYGLEQIVVCTNAGLSSKTNRKFNDKAVDGVQIRSFITTQSVKQLPEYLKDFALAPADGISPDASGHLT